MAKKENIVSYADEEIDAMIARGEDHTDWARMAAKTDAEIADDTASDPAWDGIPEDWYKHAVLVPATPEWLARQKAAESGSTAAKAPTGRRSAS